MSSRSSRTRKIKRRFHGFRFITLLLAVAVGIELVCGTIGYIALERFLGDKPSLDVDDFFAQESTLIFDKDGNEIADVGTQLRENITYDDIPEAMVDSFLAIEDSRYFQHNGFDIPRFSKAIIETLIHHNMQGGSTFTMQLVKLTYFVNDEEGTSRTKDIQYKLQQIALAIELEQKSNKKSIFEMYMNKMNFGGIGNIRGVQKAAQQYFGKDVNSLNLAECALLAGVVNSPYYYDPHFYLDHATDRRNQVLYQLLNHGYITEEEYTLAKAVKVEDLLINPNSDSSDSTGYRYQAYIDAALKEAEKITGLDPLNTSMEIYTAMDPKVQLAMEEIEAGENEKVRFADELMEIGICAENNQTGEIIAIGGGRNYAAGNGSMLLNHATEQWKQPGSSVKPWFDYAPCFDYLGWATTHVLVDKPVTYGNWTYKNASGTYSGRVTLEEAIYKSLNTTAIQAMQAVLDEKGADIFIDMLKKMEFEKFDPALFGIGFAIGGNDFICSVKELMAAHAILMNGGNYIHPHTITKIVFRSGMQEPMVPSYPNVSVISPQAAYMASWLMERAIDTSYFNYLQILQRSYATYGKTGTTDWGDSGLQYGIPQGASKDNWMVVQTTEHTIATWVGYEKAVNYNETGIATWFTREKTNMNTRGNILSEILDVIYEDHQPEALERPDGITDITHVSGIFPYVKPTDNTPDEYVAHGMIKSEYASLKDFNQSVGPLANLDSFKAKGNEDGTITLNWSSYPDSSKLNVNHDEDTTFDISWITGAVRYKARIKQGGVTLGEISSDSSEKTQKMDGLKPGTETEACGYYGYQNIGDTSNEVCVKFTSGGKKEVDVPPVGTALSEIRRWAAENKITLTETTQETENIALGDTFDLLYDGKSAFGTKVTEGAMMTVIIYAYVPAPTPVPTPTPTPEPTPEPTPDETDDPVEEPEGGDYEPETDETGEEN